VRYLTRLFKTSGINEEEGKSIEKELESVEKNWQELDIRFQNENAEYVFVNHLISLTRRVLKQEFVDDIDDSLMEEISPEAFEISNKLIEELFQRASIDVNKAELFLVATHIEIYLRGKKEKNMNEEILVVIGHRMGKGQAVARGVEKAGGRAIVIPGMAADMKLGDVMKETNATIGISFCGSGGAGALTAQNKYGYKAKSEIRSIDAACRAIEEGYKVIGLGFMDVEELGQRVVETYRKVSGDKNGKKTTA